MPELAPETQSAPTIMIDDAVAAFMQEP